MPRYRLSVEDDGFGYYCWQVEAGQPPEQVAREGAI